MKCRYLAKKNFYYLLPLIFLLSSCNETQTIPKLSNDAIILAFGDSITYGTGARPSESYPAILEKLTNRTVINAGNPGEISASGLNRLGVTLNKYQPALLILCHGGNDILHKENIKQTEQNIRQMITMAQKKNIPVILMGIPNFGIFLHTADFYRKIADDMVVVFAENIITDVLSNASLKSDPVHPNAAGYQQIANQLALLLKESGAL